MFLNFIMFFKVLGTIFFNDAVTTPLVVGTVIVAVMSSTYAYLKNVEASRTQEAQVTDPKVQELEKVQESDGFLQVNGKNGILNATPIGATE
jgi:hypothetical protein